MERGITACLLLLIVASVCWARCPDASQLGPCSCKENHSLSYVTCTDVSSVDRLQKAIHDTLDYPFEVFNLTLCNLPHVDPKWLEAKRTVQLELRRTTLDALFEGGDAPPNVSLPLLTGVIAEFSVLSFRWSHFKPFVALEYVYLLGMDVGNLGKDFRDYVSPELKNLIMFNTRTSELEDGVFEGKTKLEEITIQNNGIKILKNSFFKDQKASLTEINFSYNPIESLPNDLFEGFQKLEYVFLNHANIKTFSKTTFEDVTGHVAIYYNPLVCDCKMKWIASTHLDIDGNCEYPQSLHWKELRELTDQDFKDCRGNALPFEH